MRNAIPNMISGIMMGKVAMLSIAPAVRNLPFVMPTAPSVPMTPEMRQLLIPSFRLFHSAPIIC